MNYKLSSNTKFGMAEIYLDGKLVQSVNGYLNGGWNNSELLLLFVAVAVMKLEVLQRPLVLFKTFIHLLDI